METKNVLDLFCGAGGMSEGFSRHSEFDVLAGIDVWEDALDTYRYNYASVGLQMDMAIEDPSHVPASPNQIDIVTGGPPCKGFSLAGER
jgi:DNA (cytosine-5)-methyltransferase 1